MDRAALDEAQQLIEDEVRARFPGSPIQRVVLLQYGDDPVVEPGEIAVRVILAAGGDRAERERIMEDFNRAFSRELEKLRDDLTDRLPEARRLEVRAGEDKGGPAFILRAIPRSLETRALSGGDLTPVMARLGPTDLETLDTLITAGIASNRADAVRWTLARIRERPAYEQLRTKAREIEELKTQF